MGVPVNLDEVSVLSGQGADSKVDSHRISALPPLRITTAHMPPPRRAESVDVNGRYTAEEKGKGRDVSPANQNGNRSLPASAGGVNGVEKPVAQGRYGIGDRPEFDMAVAEDLCGIEEGEGETLCHS